MHSMKDTKVAVLRTVCVVVCVLYSTSTLLLFDPGGRYAGYAEQEPAIELSLQPAPCHSDMVLVLVHSHAGHALLRDSQRQAGEAQNVKFVFILFKSPDVEEDDITKEHSEHGDILLGDKEESYRNLVYKHMLGLRWAHEHCPSVEYVIKMDDDISVEFTGLIEVVRKNLPQTELWMMGLLQMMLPIQRHNNSKWAVSEEEFPGSHYPDFLSGWCYITTVSVVSSILSMAKVERMFWVDDVWVTGVLGSKAGVQLLSLNTAYTVYREHLACCVEEQLYHCPYLVGPTEGDTQVVVARAKQANTCRHTTCTRVASNNCRVEKPSSGVYAEVIPV